jgi:hypothetical protein
MVCAQYVQLSSSSLCWIMTGVRVNFVVHASIQCEGESLFTQNAKVMILAIYHGSESVQRVANNCRRQAVNV